MSASGRPGRGTGAGPRPAGLLDRRVVSLSWQQLRRSGKFWLAVLVSAAPIVAGVVSVVGDGIEASRPGSDGEDRFSAGYRDLWVVAVVYSAVPLSALLLAGGLLADEAEDRTLSYLLVRPVKRSTLFLSKLAPVAATAAALAAAQSLGLGLARLVSWLLFGQGDREPLDVSDARLQEIVEAGGSIPTVDTGAAIALAMLGGILAAALLAAALSAVFGFVSLCTTRFHFIANLLLYVAVEAPFSQLGGRGLGFLTATFHALSLAGAFDRTEGGVLVSSASHWALAPLALLALAAAWAQLGRWRIRTRDFNITSAAT